MKTLPMFAWLILSSSVVAQPIVPISRSSEVAVERQIWPLSEPGPTITNDSDGTSSFGSWSGTASLGDIVASQTSSTTNTGITGTFSSVAPTELTEFGTTDALSSMTVQFSLPLPSILDITGSASTVDNAPFQISTATLELDGPATFSFAAGMNAASEPISFASSVPAGQYTLLVTTRATGSVIESSQAMLDMQLTATAVPEPASIAVLVGWVALAARRRQRHGSERNR